MWTLFDTTGGGGNFFPQVEFQTCRRYNVIFMEDGTRHLQWNNYAPYRCREEPDRHQLGQQRSDRRIGTG